MIIAHLNCKTYSLVFTDVDANTKLEAIQQYLHSTNIWKDCYELLIDYDSLRYALQGVGHYIYT